MCESVVPAATAGAAGRQGNSLRAGEGWRERIVGGDPVEEGVCSVTLHKRLTRCAINLWWMTWTIDKTIVGGSQLLHGIIK